MSAPTGPTDEDPPTLSRHRAEPSLRRRVTTALALLVAGLLGTALLGWITADLVGLTDGAATAVAYEAPAPSIEAAAPADPMLRTLDLSRTSATGAAETTPPARATTAATRPAAASTEPLRATAPPAEPTPQAARVATVRPGDPCSAEGSTAVTKSGDRMVCSASRGNGSLRWRRA